MENLNPAQGSHGALEGFEELEESEESEGLPLARLNLCADVMP